MQLDPGLKQLLLRRTGSTSTEIVSEEISGEVIPVVARLVDPSVAVDSLRVVARFGSIVGARAAPEPYLALGYEPSEIDPNGAGTHGTHVLDIAAGNGAAAGSAPGMAREADLLFVHVRGDDTMPTDTLGDSVSLLEAVRWVV